MRLKKKKIKPEVITAEKNVESNFWIYYSNSLVEEHAINYFVL